jgi:hypothetical protein
MNSVAGLLDRWLDPVSKALNAEAARQLLDLRADDEMQHRVEELADRNTEGLLTAEERSEYEAIIAASELVAVLQAKARSRIAGGVTAA